MDRATVEIYEQGAVAYAENRQAYHPDRAEEFAGLLPAGALRLDLGAGPGHYLPHLGRPIVAADAAVAMVAEARQRHRTPSPPLGVVCDQEALPFRHGAFSGVWSSKSLQHVEATRLPMALAGLHRALEVGGVLDVTVFAGEGAQISDDEEFPGRLFTWWQPDALRDVLVGAGFDVEDVTVDSGNGRNLRLTARASRARTLPDTVGGGMRLLVVGLNPSLYAADAGVGFARPGNRYWPAARAAGLVADHRDRDTDGALREDGIGMTDIVKRATVAAAELTAGEYRAGLARVERLVRWLQPRAVCFVGLAGWRSVVDRKAVPGVQPEDLGGAPVYVMPSTSGLNAGSRLADLTDHLRAAAALADSVTRVRLPGGA